MKPGVFTATKKDGTLYYRASITFCGRHISLGSFSTEDDAATCYELAKKITSTPSITVDDYTSDCVMDFEKWISLINFRDNGIYCRTPLYIKDKYFIYYLSLNEHLIFDADDLFYYSTHKIMKRGGHLFVADYGMQVNILSRYGIKNYAVAGKDYVFKNGVENDFRYSNIEVINKYHGVSKTTHKGKTVYLAKIHVNGDIIIGRYHTDYEAAIAYNKAADILKSKGINKDFPVNYIVDMDIIKYSSTYNRLRISRTVRDFLIGS